MRALEKLRQMETIASGSTYCLRLLKETDRGEYLKTMRETAQVPELFDMDFFEDAAWKVAITSTDSMTIPIERRNDRAYIGQFVLKQVEEHMVELGLDLQTQYQNRGIGTEVMTILLSVLRQQCPEDVLIARAYSDNHRSIHLIQKLGGVRVGDAPAEYETAKAVMTQLLEENKPDMQQTIDLIVENHIDIFRF